MLKLFFKLVIGIALLVSSFVTYAGPIGEILLWASTVMPSGYLPCDGRELSVDEYLDLYRLLGTTYGGVIARTFRLPDTRGLFVRGLNPSDSGRDPGRHLGIDIQEDALQEHHHSFNSYLALQSGSATLCYSSHPRDQMDVIGRVLGARAAGETRPANIALIYIIKCREGDVRAFPSSSQTKSHIGNCLFDSVGEIVHMAGIDLRRRATTHIRSDEELRGFIQTAVDAKNPRDFLMTASGEPRQYRSVDEYINIMEQDQTWGTNIEVIALSRTLRRSIRVYIGNNPPLDYTVPNAVEELIELDYVTHNHYRIHRQLPFGFEGTGGLGNGTMPPPPYSTSAKGSVS